MIKRLSKDKYLVRVSLGLVGKTVKLHNRTIYGNRQEAEAYHRDIVQKRKQGLPITPTKLTLALYLKQWLDNRIAKAVIRPNTAQEYRRVLDRYVIPRCGSVKLADLRPFHVEEVLQSMGGLSSTTIRHVLTVWHSALTRAIKMGLLHTNALDAIERPASTRPTIRAFNRDEAMRFLEEARGDKFEALFYLALYTGMRPEETVGLQWQHVDLDGMTIKVRRVIIWLKGAKWQFGEPKTKRSVRDIHVPPAVIKRLREHRSRQLERSMKVKRFYRDDLDLVFGDRLGLPLRYQGINERYMRPICERAGLGRASLYTLRHTFATLLLEDGENVKVVSEMLGHASVMITMDRYCHVLPSMSEGASRRLEKLLKI